MYYVEFPYHKYHQTLIEIHDLPNYITNRYIPSVTTSSSIYKHTHNIYNHDVTYNLS